MAMAATVATVATVAITAASRGALLCAIALIYIIKV